MDKLNLYRELIQRLLTARANLHSGNAPIESQTIFDITKDHYQLMHVGWKNSSTRIYGCVLYVDIKDGKIWVQHDGTEDALADQLVSEGVPKQDIAIAYHAPHVRQYTEFGVD
ncbi:XisI protein [Nostoc sp.]|uniref:XisI protein n=1 Tax=Nostoc sp. TaxID=1180 RepID=UPI002FF64FFB